MSDKIADKKRIVRKDEGLKSVRGSGVYEPHPIAERFFSFKGETLSCEAKTIVALVRLDEQVRNFDYAQSWKESVSRIEAMATVRTDGIKPDLMQVLFLEAANRSQFIKPRESKMFLRKWFPASEQETIEASYEALCSLKAIEYILDFEPSEEGLGIEHLEKLYDLCIRGTRREREDGFRARGTSKRTESVGSTGATYIMPDAQKVESLLEDLMSFSNRDYLPPIIRSAIVHFQLEAIHPVYECIDRLGRMITFLMWRQCGLLENIMPPFSITPAVQTGKHTELLVPYKTTRGFEKRTSMTALDDWVAHCSRATRRSVRFAQDYRTGIEDLEALWRERLPGIHRGSSLDILLTRLPGMPILTVSDVARLTNKRFQTANENVTRLLEANILKPIAQGKRNRLFSVPEAIHMLQKTEHKLFPADAIPREAFFVTEELAASEQAKSWSNISSVMYESPELE